MSTFRSSSKPRPRVATYYARLKVAQDAPPEVIRAAHRALVQKYHPDRHKGSLRHEQVVAALNRAQDILLDPASRASHDQWIRDEEVRLGLREPPEGAEGSEGRLGAGLRRLRAALGGSSGRDEVDDELGWLAGMPRPRSPLRRYGVAITLMALAAGGGAAAVILAAHNDLHAVVAREAVLPGMSAASTPGR